MKEVDELAILLRPHLDWNFSRLVFLAQFMMALIKVRRLNLKRVAEGFSGDAKTDSCYKRIQRFIANFPLCPITCARFIVAFAGLEGPFVICIDRTNWKLGSANINLLVLSVNWYNTSIPIFTIALDKRGNSNTKERIKLLRLFIRTFGADTIKHVVADREFKGASWLKYLKKKQISFTLRIPNNTQVTTHKGRKLNVSNLFRMAKNTRHARPRFCKIWGEQKVWLSAFRAQNTLVIVISDEHSERALQDYQERWQIETVFQAFKGRGFNFEDTHVTDPKRLEKLVTMVTLTLCWCYHTGLEEFRENPIKCKNHGRFEMSIFSSGLSILSRILLNLSEQAEAWKNVRIPFMYIRKDKICS